MASSARTIHPLPDHLINQIAAGEVIERPASVVKELVENCLDAGARSITVELEQGGLARIAVTDDGRGIGSGDLPGALARHWTSKLDADAGLETIPSLGFRGEALASIASVADVEIVSREAGAEHAWRVIAPAGRPAAAPVPCSAPAGTRVVVRALFHNVPARRRFLKRPRTEFLHVQRLLRRIAFAVPNVALALVQAGSRGLRLPPLAAGTDARWSQLFGEAFWRDAIPVAGAADEVRVTGWVGGPSLASSQSELQYLALNGRSIRDRNVAHAVRLAFDERLPEGRFPAWALAIDMPLEDVDVNVHPGKLEVRFAAARDVHDLVHALVARALAGETVEPLSDTRDDSVREPRRSGAAAAKRSTSTRSSPAVRSGPRLGTTTGAGRTAHSFGRPLALVSDRWLLYADADRTRALDLRRAWRSAIALRLAATPDEVAGRPLLFPERLRPGARLPEPETLAALARRGVVLDALGDNAGVLRRVPAMASELEAERFLDALLAQLGGDGHAHEPDEAIARAVGASVVLGREGRPAAAMLEALQRVLATTGSAPEGGIELDDATLSRLAKDDDD